MKKDEIINTLQTDKQFLNNNFGVVMIALFGCYDKWQENSDSVVGFYIGFK